MVNLATTDEEVISSLTDEQTVQAKVKLIEARSLRDQAEELWWNFGEVLYEIWDGALYQADGYISWQEYVEGALDISYTSARNAVNTYKWLSGFDADFKRWVHELGATKASLMAGRFEADDAAVWQNRLDGLTCRQMTEVLRGKDPEQLTGQTLQVNGTAAVMGVDYGVDGYENGMPPHVQDALLGTEDEEAPGTPLKEATVLPPDVDQAEVVHFSLFPEQRRNLSQALEHAKQLAQTDKSGHALDLICTAYLAGDGGHQSATDILRSLERALGVRLVAFRRDLSIAYGEETLGLVVDFDD